MSIADLDGQHTLGQVRADKRKTKNCIVLTGVLVNAFTKVVPS